MSDSSRLAAHVLVDAVVARDQGVDQDANVAAMNIATADLASIGAVTVSEDAADEITVDVSPLVNAALFAIGALMRRLADATGWDRELVAAQLREDIDDSMS